jgi:hypothetical protein
MFTQEFLRAQLESRMRTAARTGRTPQGDDGQADHDTAVTVVVRRFDPCSFARAAVEAVSGFPDDLREAWLGSYTRTVFLSGDPDNLRGRFAFHHVGDAGATAWTLPGERRHQAALRRLLQLFPDSPLPALPSRQPVGEPAPVPPDHETRLHLATSGVTRSGYLVHLHHVLAEAVLTGRLKDASGLVLCHLPQLDPAEGPYSMLRVVPEPSAPDGRLRAFAGLAGGVERPSRLR